MKVLGPKLMKINGELNAPTVVLPSAHCDRSQSQGLLMSAGQAIVADGRVAFGVIVASDVVVDSCTIVICGVIVAFGVVVATWLIVICGLVVVSGVDNTDHIRIFTIIHWNYEKHQATIFMNHVFSAIKQQQPRAMTVDEIIIHRNTRLQMFKYMPVKVSRIKN